MLKHPSLAASILVLLAGPVSWAQPPEILWYRFDEGQGATSTQNLAVPGQGLTSAPIVGHSIVDGVGCGGTPGLFGSGAGTNEVQSGWATTLGQGDWTLGFWLDMRMTLGITNAFMYTSGDINAGGFRTFTHGAAGSGNIMLRGPLADTVIPGGGSQTQPVHVCWVYDASVPEIRGYLDGVLASAVPQSPLSITGSPTSPGFTVGRYSGSTSALLSGCIMDDFRMYARALSATEVLAWAGFCLGPQWQVNQPGSSSLDIDGLASSPLSPIQVTLCMGGFATLNSDGPAGNPWDLGASARPGIPVAGGAWVSPGGQIVNLDPTDPQLTFLNGLGFATPYPGPFSLPFGFGASAVQAHAQQVNIDPANPSGDGFGLSAFNSVHVTTFTTVTGPSSDDSFLRIAFAGLCGAPGAITFAGTQYTDLYVNSNGSVSFGGGDTSFMAGPAAFAAGRPRLAGLWTDLAPNAGGQIVTTFTGGTLVVCSFQNVREYGTSNTSSVDHVFDVAAGSAMISAYVPAPGHITTTLVGLTPGGGATNPGPVGGNPAATFIGLVGAGPQANAATDMIYEFVLGGTPAPGWSSIVFPNADATSWVVN